GYSSKPNQRNTIQFDAISKPYKTDQHEHKLLSDIDRYMLCQNMPTMFSHKLVAVTDRYNKHKMVAGRDIYDIYYFFINGNKYNPAIIEERTNLQPKAYLTNLHDFISKHISDVDLSNDLNTLLPYKTFNSLRNSLKSLVLDLLTQEIKRI
ncbi:MAG: hypothetical protein Q8Q65_01770, partial [bacterium]|nr:hypothetical protein [bacterium]